MAWYVALRHWAHHSLFKWCPKVDLELFYGKVKFGLLCFCMGKTVRKSFNGRNLQQMTKVTKGLCLYKNSDPKGLSAPVPGLYTCIKTWKIMYKIRLQRYFFETCNKWAKWQGFSVDVRILSTKGCLPLPRGYMHVEKHLKMCIKSEFKEICLKLSTNGRSDKGFLLTSNVCPQRVFCPCPELYTCIKSLKMCIKSDFEEIILKLATYGQRENAFLLS